ncbi:hypothetical protein ART_3982 [Arthrobacter sp. PAMC 25486]|uniref:ATP-binding protein n=1 Tax=Arthrobacter sp. PAMC 25486 TaxID=1494608 RepID=UPI000535D49F|nr:ATP-binding protein [Arthrobacter sp. PAMC 25486]AIY03581.1 hypothetical protein ART_3982 [Arthrobacter sp. PAMC 25486]
MSETTTIPTALAATPGTGTVKVSALGVIIDVEGLSAPEAAEFRTAWSRCLAGPEHPAAATVQRMPGDFARANESLTSHITLAAIEQQAGRRMMFHACGLADPLTGATIAFIAPSGTGKTTLARTLGTARGYVSDETIAVAADLSITPYPKPLSVKQPEPGVPKRQEGPEQHQLGDTPAAPTLQSIVLLSRVPGNDRISVEDVALADALLELTPQLSALARLERGLVQLCAMIEACGGVKRIRYAEARDIAGVLPQFSTHDGGTPPEWAALECAPSPGSAVTGTGIRRASVQDAVEADGTVFLLAESQVMELSPLGALIWELSGDWISKDALLEGVVAVLGAHPSAGSLLEAALEELLARGVLELA